MSATGRLSVLRKHKIQGRTAKILALIPMQHAPSETSDKSDPNSDNELAMQLSLQLLHQRPTFTAHGLYKFNYALFEQTARSVSTYLVILLQFVTDANM
ncbi:unnamed protein product [Arctia plantaginis]|uniref:Gustatory receptor n=1 Tax=Arctia plantaginis TaxID=874455 RepID=A0A8S1AH31_ARCPL|nr:unnamed protein product [Arctia plantaginis]